MPRNEENLEKDECLLHVDFSENYACKYNKEIQSVHFGGSHKQASLHTGVLYKVKDGNEVQAEGFCTISACTDHGPPAIWAHLDPILKSIREEMPEITKLLMWSDSPSTQYRQKGNFFFISTLPFQMGFKAISWNFFESGHGKGAADGIGGAVKRTTDSLVSHGEDLSDPKGLYMKLQKASKTKLYFIEEEKVKAMATKLPNLTTIPGTMRIHQVTATKSYNMVYRDVSCCCKLGTLCRCENAKSYNFPGGEVHEHEPSLQSVHPDLPAIGKFCVIRYEGQAFPGKVLDMDENDVQVTCMHKVGENQFFWPAPLTDVLYYPYEDVLRLIPEPKPVTKIGRHFQVDPIVWKSIQRLLQINILLWRSLRASQTVITEEQ